jgi:hypothetical protein
MGPRMVGSGPGPARFRRGAKGCIGMRVALLLATSLLLAGAFAGCADREAPAGAASPETTAKPAGPVDLSVEGAKIPDGNASAGGADGAATALSPFLNITASGPAGSWIIVHAPFDEDSSSVGFCYSYEAVTSAQEDGSGAFFWPLALTSSEADADWTVSRGPPFNSRFATFKAAEQTWAREGCQGSSGPDFEGMIIAFAAETDWTFALEVELEDDLFGPAVVVQGIGATFRHGSDAEVPVPGNGPVNQLAFEAEVPGPGWSHLEVLRYRVQPDGVGQVGLRLPTYEQSALGVSYGFYVPLGGGSAGSSNVLDYIGTLADAAGTATAEVTYARSDLTVDFAYVHLPVTSTDLPGLTGEGYMGSTWPFDDLPTPP